MPRTLKPINTQKIDSQLNRALRMPDRRALMQDHTPRSLQLLDDRPGGVARGLDDADAFLDDDARVGRVVGGLQGGQQGQVHGEGVGGEGAAFADLGAQVFGGGLGEGGQDAQAAGVGDGGGEGGVADPLHAALDDGDFGKETVRGGDLEKGDLGRDVPLMPRRRVSSVLKGMVGVGMEMFYRRSMVLFKEFYEEIDMTER